MYEVNSERETNKKEHRIEQKQSDTQIMST